LLIGTSIKGADALLTNYTKDKEMIKIINATHSAFLRHNLNDGIPDFTAGTCTIEENKYTKFIDYFSTRE
jgi:hypothetical protein